MLQNAPSAGLFTPAFFSQKPLTREETHALHLYQGVDYSVINMLLRHPHAFHASFSFRRHHQVASLINRLDTAMAKHHIKQPLIVYRGLSTAIPIAAARRMTGTVFHDPAFVSTTLDLAKALAFSQEGGTLMRIILPTASQAICMDTIEDLDESELLLARNGRFRILSAGEQTIREPEHGTSPETIHRRLVINLCLLPEEQQP